MRTRPVRSLLLLLGLPLLAASASATVGMDWVTIDAPGNAPDDAINCLPLEEGSPDCGSVPYVYSISRYEVTNAQYAEFLNAKGAADPFGLYNPNMGSEAEGGITRSGSPGSYSYAVKPGFENKPVNWVSFYDSLRFANWLDNGQGNADTETGSYTITTGGIATNTIVRNPGAGIVVPSENEWYKAAYYDPHSASYFEYPTGTNAEVVCSAPTSAPNSANCNSAVGAATDVGAYTGSASPFGTFDQGGNFFEWNEEIVSPTFRGVRGEGWGSAASTLAASNPGYITATTEFGIRIGFRVANLVPEPDSGPLALACFGCLAALHGRRARAMAPRSEV